MNSASYHWDIVQRLSFNRVAGTADCERAADLIEAEVNRLGGTVAREDFTFDYFVIDRASFRVTEPYEKEYTVTGYERARSTGEEGLDGEFFYAEDVFPGIFLRSGTRSS